VALFEKLKEAHIFVRHFNKPERIARYLRISIGTDEEMQTLIEFLRGYRNN
jgi:histidinol-phosphate aminotransferase